LTIPSQAFVISLLWFDRSGFGISVLGVPGEPSPRDNLQSLFSPLHSIDKTVFSSAKASEQNKTIAAIKKFSLPSPQKIFI